MTYATIRERRSKQRREIEEGERTGNQTEEARWRSFVTTINSIQTHSAKRRGYFLWGVPMNICEIEE
jgi:hypothetical protein